MPTDGDSVADVVARFSNLVKPILTVTKVKPSSANALESLESALAQMPSGNTFCQALDDLREQLRCAIDDEGRQIAGAFGPIEAAFVRAAQEQGKPWREQNDGWRIGPLEFQFRRQRASARVLYNHEVVEDWTRIGAVHDLETLEQKALRALESSAIPESALVTVFWDAYDQERLKRQREGKQRFERVPIIDFYRGIRAALIRFELEGQKPEKRLKYTDMPRWMFLYNLDRYRALGNTVPESKRLVLETGSQQEVARNLGVSVNGLDAQQDYKTMCHVVAQGAVP
jgi:hypothetical protein